MHQRVIEYSLLLMTKAAIPVDGVFETVKSTWS